ncbi:MAG: hypothetical protein ABEK29_08030, partial [Bradymonadaceae bacterium]
LPWASSWPPVFEPMVWRRDNRVLEIRPQYGCCSEMWGLLVLRVDHEGRICGRKDGFDAWFDGFRNAADGAKLDRIAEMMAYPLERTSVPSVPADSRGPIRDREAFLEILENLRADTDGPFPFRPKTDDGCNESRCLRVDQARYLMGSPKTASRHGLDGECRRFDQACS